MSSTPDPERPEPAGSAQSRATGVVDAWFSRGDVTVLRDLTLLVEEGEILAVLGPSGCGKTTLLRCIAGLETLDAGHVLIRGRQVDHQPPADRRVGMVFEEGELVPFLDVAANLGWGLKVRHVPRDEASRQVSDRARRFRLGRVLKRSPRELSLGERSTVGIGRAMMGSAQVYLLDEPLAHLDPTRRGVVRRQIVDILRASGAPAIYVTHDQADAMAAADRLVLLDQGRVMQSGPPMELYHRPANVQVAALVGTPPFGFLPARVVEAQGLAGFQVDGRTLPLWSAPPEGLAGRVGAPVLLAWRASDVVPAGPDGQLDAQEAGAVDRVALSGTVVGLEHSGRDAMATVDVDGVDLRSVAEPVLAATPGATLRASFRPGAAPRIGQRVELAVDAARAHVFDPATGRAIWHPPTT